MKPKLALAACLWASGLSVAFAQTLQVIPNQILVDEAAAVRATGLQPNEHVSIQAELVDGESHTWASRAEFAADAQGVVDTSNQAPVKGSYSGVSAAGLVWSMRPTEKHVSSYRPPRDLGTQVIEFRLVRDGRQVANARLEQMMVASGVRRKKLEGHLHGVLFLPGIKQNLGGSAEGDAQSSLDAIPKVLEFLRQSLGPEGDAPPRL